jgi:hypothetical protein
MKKTQKQLGQKQETAQQQQKKNSKNKNPDLRSKLSNQKKKTHYLRNIIEELITSETKSLKSYRSMKKMLTSKLIQL